MAKTNMLSTKLYLVIALAAALVLSGCENAFEASWSQTVSTHYEANRLLALDAYFSLPTQTISIQAYADVEDGTPGELEITGPRHLRCPGTFTAHQPVDLFGPFPSDQERKWGTIANLPRLVLDAGPGGSIIGPKGVYTVAVRVAGATAQLTSKVDAGQMSYPGPASDYTKPSACFPVADSQAQRRDLLDAYLTALEKYLGGAPLSLQHQFMASLGQARNEIAIANSATNSSDMQRASDTAAQALRQLEDDAKANEGALFPTPTARIVDATSDAIHLLEPPR